MNKPLYTLFFLIIFCTAVSQDENHVNNTNIVLSPANTTLNNQRITKTVIPEECFSVDAIKVIIYTAQSTEIITQSDLERPGFDGQIRTLDDLVFQTLVYLDAVKFNMLPNDQAVEESIAKIQKDNNLTSTQMDNLFTQSGYTVKEGMQGFKKMQAINTMIDFKIRSNLVVPRSAVVTYYEENPIVKEALYTLQTATISFDSSKDKNRKKRVLDDYIKQGVTLEQIEWSQPFSVNHTDIAAEKHFVYTMKNGDIRFIQENNAFVLFKLNEKNEQTLVSLQERYKEISDILRKPRFDELMELYKKELFENASIVYK